MSWNLKQYEKLWEMLLKDCSHRLKRQVLMGGSGLAGCLTTSPRTSPKWKHYNKPESVQISSSVSKTVTEIRVSNRRMLSEKHSDHVSTVIHCFSCFGGNKQFWADCTRWTRRASTKQFPKGYRKRGHGRSKTTCECSWNDTVNPVSGQSQGIFLRLCLPHVALL